MTKEKSKHEPGVLESMSSAFLDLLDSLGVKPRQPASAAVISAFEKAAMLELPMEVRQLYAVTDGVTLQESVLQILSLEESLTWIKAFRETHVPACFGYFPLADDFESNPFCVCCNDPMKGMIVRVHHDGDPRLTFRSLKSFIKWLATPGWENNRLFSDLEGDFSGPTRTQEDLTVAKQLRTLAESLADVERTEAERFSLALLSEAEIDDIIERLESNDTYVRVAAETILRKMDNGVARDALRVYRDKLRQFADRCAQILAEAGIKVVEYDERFGRCWPLLWVEKNGKRTALNHFFLYDQRNASSFPLELPQWATRALERE